MLKRLKGNIREIIVVLIILVCVIVVIGSISIHEVELIREKQKYNVLASDIKEGIRDFDLKDSSEYQGLVIVAENLIPDSKEETIINNNTIYLQACIDEVSNSGGGIVRIPAGNFYFKKAEGKGREGVSYCVIECRDNVIVEGAGTDERTGTILRPYAPNSDLAVDMFFFNEIAISRNPVFLKNADFRNFIIDGNEAHCEVYSSAGKGFMINLFEDCDWENVVVKNTDGTGFGVDCPINCTIKDCIAINCGKAASENNVGASGFGIGTGYSNEESMIISNCIAIGNKKYGFFFEHQGRFYNREYNPYTATKSEGFVVSNCTASGNLYDFGGARANDVTYQNCISKVNMENDRTLSSIYFESNSVRNHIVNCKVEKKFTDVLDNSVYYNSVNWAVNNGITEGVSKTEFGIEQNCTRIQAIIFLFRLANRPGDVVFYSGIGSNTLSDDFTTGYTDIDGIKIFEGYLDAIKWAKNEGIIDNSSTMFFPNNDCTRADFITWLWKCAGKPVVQTGNNFEDVPAGAYYEDAVDWAVNQGIANGTSLTTFSPDELCARGQVVIFLNRFVNTKIKYYIKYNLDGGIAATNPVSYNSGVDTFIINNPSKEGYTFEGWTGSNYSEYVESNYIPQKTVQVTTSDVGNKVYTANYIANNYIVSFNANGGTGSMEDEYFTYDAVPQMLLKNSFTRRGYVFKGWNTKSNGTGDSYADAEFVENLTEVSNGKITLYAQWAHEEHIEVTDKAEEATCTEAGKTEGKHCEVCNEVLVAQTEIPAKGHTEVVNKGSEATCTESGLTEGKHCEVCKEVIVEQKTIPAKGHKEVIDAGIEATCTESGLTEGKHCEVCKEVTVKQKTIPAKGHKEVIDRGIEATCTEAGKTEGKHCEVCKEVIVEQRVIQELGHKFENAECTRCGEKEPKITLISKIYEIGEKYITKIKSKTKVKDLKGKIETNAKEIKIYSKENLEVKDEEIIGTGMQVHLRRENEKKTLILVIAGDVNGDGEVKVSDMTILNRYRLNKRSLEEESIMAGDVTADGKVDFKDIVKINRYRLNKITDL